MWFSYSPNGKLLGEWGRVHYFRCPRLRFGPNMAKWFAVSTNWLLFAGQWILSMIVYFEPLSSVKWVTLTQLTGAEAR